MTSDEVEGIKGGGKFKPLMLHRLIEIPELPGQRMSASHVDNMNTLNPNKKESTRAKDGTDKSPESIFTFLCNRLDETISPIFLTHTARYAETIEDVRMF